MPDEDKSEQLKPRVFSEEIHENLSLSVEFEAKIRRGFSIPHLRAAEHFAEELRRHEELHAGAGFGLPWDRARWLASAAILLAFSAVEAALDETEDDLAIPEPLLRPFQRAPFWDRVGAVLAYVGAEQLEKGREPYESAELLRTLRNGLAHPKAEWSDERTTHKSLSDRINRARLPLSPFNPDPEEAFPIGCMSAGVADWAALSAGSFIRELGKRCGLECRVHEVES